MNKRVEVGATYHYIDFDMTISSHVNLDDAIDLRLLTCFNYFHTEEEAIEVRDKTLEFLKNIKKGG